MNQHVEQKTILKQIYDGEFYPARDVIPKNQDYMFLCKKLEEEYRYFQRLSIPEIQTHFINYCSLSDDICEMENYVYFENGFRAGAALMKELAFEEVKKT